MRPNTENPRRDASQSQRELRPNARSKRPKDFQMDPLFNRNPNPNRNVNPDSNLNSNHDRSNSASSHDGWSPWNFTSSASADTAGSAGRTASPWPSGPAWAPPTNQLPPIAPNTSTGPRLPVDTRGPLGSAEHGPDREPAHAETVDDLLLLARLDEQRPSERSPVDLAVLAADACSDARVTAADRPVTLAAPEPVVIFGLPDHLRQAIANLVTNAIRHTPAGTPIEISARLVDGDAVVQVRDHGPGLDGEAAAHVFDRFWQADSARVGVGSGLGLAIVEGIAAEHGGRASVANALHGGAVFTIRIPTAQPGQPWQPTATRSATRSAAAG